MYKLLGWYIFVLGIFPVIALVLLNKANFTPLLIILSIVAGYYVPALFTIKPPVKKKEFQPMISVKAINSFILIYFITRAPFILEIVIAIYEGRYWDFGLELTIQRYSGTSDDSFLEKISTIMFIAYATSLGINVMRMRKSWIGILLLMIPIELSSFARASVLLALAAFATEALIQYRNKLKYVSFGQKALYVVSISILLFIIFFFAAYGRVHKESDIGSILIEKTLIYSIAMYEALMHWFLNLDYKLSFGYYTIGGVYKFFGVSIPQGVFEFVLTTYGPTNVYTVFRNLVEDFSIFGAALYFLVAGVTFKLCESRMTLGNYTLTRSMAYPIIYFFYSPFIFATVFVGFYLPQVVDLSSRMIKVVLREYSRLLRKSDAQSFGFLYKKV
jgi:oligosaccharide repeat unit polymerase